MKKALLIFGILLTAGGAAMLAAGGLCRYMFYNVLDASPDFYDTRIWLGRILLPSGGAAAAAGLACLLCRKKASGGKRSAD